MEFLTSPNLELKKIRHGFFTRQGGVSDGIYASLNCGPGSGDDLAKVMENRARVAQALGGALVTAYQIHSNKAIIVEKPWEMMAAPQADALVTKTPGIALGVLTADCLPILLADEKARVIAAVHAGWKGAFDGVIDAAVDAMVKLGASVENIIAAIGPGIAQKSYEIGPEFHGRFLQQSIENANYFAESARAGHYLFDLAAYARGRLARAGVSRVNSLARDTCSEENAFFSYRRATLRKESAYGRQVSVIVLET